MSEIIVRKYDHCAEVKIHRPDALNALNRAVLEQMLVVLKDLENDHIKALILTGEGTKAFAAGADIKAMAHMSHLDMLDFCSLGQKVSLALEQAPFLTLAAVNGYALGGGLELALACDFIYASSQAKLGLPEITLGIIPGFGGTQRLTRAIGTRAAKEMILSGKMVTALEAQKLGIVNQIFEPEQLIAACEEMTQMISKFSSTAIQQAKAAINHGYSLAMGDALELEKNLFAVCFATPERQESMQAFMTKKG